MRLARLIIGLGVTAALLLASREVPARQADPGPAAQEALTIRRADTASEEGIAVRMLPGRHFEDLPNIQAYNIDARLPTSFQVHFGAEHRAIRAFVAEVAAQGREVAGIHRHYTEAILFILRGKGYSIVSNGSGDPIRFDWQAGDIWSPPLNWIHDHYAADPQVKTRFLAVLNEPAVTSFMPFKVQRTLNKEENPGIYVRTLPYEPLETASAELPATARFPFAWRGMVIRDLRDIGLKPWRGGGSAARLDISEVRSLEAYVGALRAGEQTVMERLMCEAFVYIVSGKGYSWIWREGEEKVKYEWKAGDLLALPLNVWRQHVSVQDDTRYYQISNRPMMEALLDSGFVVKDNTAGAPR